MKYLLVVIYIISSKYVFSLECSDELVLKKLNLKKSEVVFSSRENDSCILFYDGDAKSKCHGCKGILKVAHLKDQKVIYNGKILESGFWGKVSSDLKFKKVSSDKYIVFENSGYTGQGQCEKFFTAFLISSDFKHAKPVLEKRVQGCNKNTGFNSLLKASTGGHKDLILETTQESTWNKKGIKRKELYSYVDKKYILKKVLSENEINYKKVKVAKFEYNVHVKDNKIIFQRMNDEFYVDNNCLVFRNREKIGVFWGSVTGGGGLVYKDGKEVELDGNWSVFNCAYGSKHYEDAMKSIQLNKK